MMVQKQSYKKGQITQSERIEIYALIKQKLSYREIGRRLGRHHTTILREVIRNSIDKGWDIYEYNPLEAEEKRIHRRYKANHKHIILWKDNRQRELLERYLKEKGRSWGPDEILGRIRIELGIKVVGTATFYRFIRENKPLRQRYLRYKQRGYRTKNKGNKRKKMYQDVINVRGRLGDFEGDTVVSGRKYGGGLVSLADRRSRYYMIKKVGNLKSGTINMTINVMLKGEKVESITFDNGIEFSGILSLPHQCYRADAYSSWQRGTNERHNGFLRRYIPKGANIDDRSDLEIQNIQNMINHKPRKILGYKTPYEVYYNKNLIYIT